MKQDMIVILDMGSTENTVIARDATDCAQNVIYCARTYVISIRPSQIQRPLFWRALQKSILRVIREVIICGDTGWQYPPAGYFPDCDHCAGSPPERWRYPLR